MTHLHNCISTIFFPPVDHVGPHVLCFLNIKFPCFQESATSVNSIFILYFKANKSSVLEACKLRICKDTISCKLHMP